MRIGITGGRGVLGRLTESALIARGHSVSLFPGDILNHADIAAWFRGNEMDALFHYAAVVPVDKVRADPAYAYAVNVSGTISLLRECLAAGGNLWLLFASSSHVYTPSDEDLPEHSALGGASLYGHTKSVAESICAKIAEQHPDRLTVCMARIFSFYHATQKEPFLYPTILRRLHNEDLSRPFLLPGAESLRDMLPADVVVRLLIALMERRAAGIVNVGSGHGTRIADFVQSLTDVALEICSDGGGDRLVADVRKLRAILGEHNA